MWSRVVVLCKVVVVEFEESSLDFDSDVFILVNFCFFNIKSLVILCFNKVFLFELNNGVNKKKWNVSLSLEMLVRKRVRVYEFIDLEDDEGVDEIVMYVINVFSNC